MDISNVKKKLQDSGYKLTSQREAILNVMAQYRNEHLSCDEIYGIVGDDHPDLGIATVYRTLQLFEKLGVVYRVNFDDGCSRYELISDAKGHQHHHLICLGCGKVIEVKLDLLDSLEDEIEEEENFTIVDHNVKFYGYCSDCENKSL